MASKKKLLTSVVALGTAAALALGGTFAWQSINQTALNEASDIVNPGGRLHNDLYYIDAKTTDSNIYVENFADDEIFARVRLEEYMEVVMNYGTAAERVEIVTGEKTIKDGVTDVSADGATQKDKFDYSYTVHKFGEDAENATDAYFWLTAGTVDSSAVYMPTFNVNKDSLTADIHGLYADRVGGISSRGEEQYTEVPWTVDDEKTGNEIYDADYNSADELNTLTVEELNNLIDNGTGAEAFADNIILKNATHTAAEVGTTRGLISIEEWLSKSENDEDTDRYWVYDEDGWIYWSSPIAAHSTTGLLLDSFTLNHVMDDTWYYAINVVGQFVTANDVGKRDNTGFYAVADEKPTTAAETLLTLIGVDMSSEGISGSDGSDENGAIDSLSVLTTGDRNWYSAAYSTTDPITLTVSGKWYKYSPWTNGEVDEATLEAAQWTLTGNTSESTTLSASTGKNVTLTLGEGETGELTVSAVLTYGGMTETGTEIIYNEPHVGSFNLYTTDSQYLSATTKYQADTTTTYQLLIFPKYLGDLSKYDPDTAYTGEILKDLVADLSFVLTEDTEDAQETTIEGVTLTQDPTDKSKVTLTIVPDVKENFRITYKWTSGGSGYNAFQPIPAFTALTNAAASDNKVELAAGESTEFKLEGQFGYYDVDMSITGHKANGDELAEILTFDVAMDYDDPTKVTVTHTCSPGHCTCDAELAYCTLTATASEYPETTITSEVQIWRAVAAADLTLTAGDKLPFFEAKDALDFTVGTAEGGKVASENLTVKRVLSGSDAYETLTAAEYSYDGESGTLTLTAGDKLAAGNAVLLTDTATGEQAYVLFAADSTLTFVNDGSALDGIAVALNEKFDCGEYNGVIGYVTFYGSGAEAAYTDDKESFDGVTITDEGAKGYALRIGSSGVARGIGDNSHPNEAEAMVFVRQ